MTRRIYKVCTTEASVYNETRYKESNEKRSRSELFIYQERNGWEMKPSFTIAAYGTDFPKNERRAQPQSFSDDADRDVAFFFSAPRILLAYVAQMLASPVLIRLSLCSITQSGHSR